MRKMFFVALMMMCASAVSAQMNRFGAAYYYQWAPQWDKAVQTYNFSRPSLTENQPLLIHGIGACYAHGGVHQFECSWRYFRSAATNPGLTSVFNLHFIEAGYVFHHDGERFFYDAGISASGGFLFRRENGALMKIDDKFPLAAGIGANLTFRYGLRLLNNNGKCICPFAGISCNPCFFSPYSEGLLNQTKGLVGKAGTLILSAQAGIFFAFNGM